MPWAGIKETGTLGGRRAAAASCKLNPWHSGRQGAPSAGRLNCQDTKRRANRAAFQPQPSHRSRVDHQPCLRWVSMPATPSFGTEQVGKWIWKHSTGPETSGHELELSGQSREEPRAEEPQSWWTEAPGWETTRKEDTKGFQVGNQALCWPAALSSAIPPHPPEVHTHPGSAPVGRQAWSSHRKTYIPGAGPEDSTTEQCHLVPVAVDLLCAMCFTVVIT